MWGLVTISFSSFCWYVCPVCLSGPLLGVRCWGGPGSPPPSAPLTPAPFFDSQQSAAPAARRTECTVLSKTRTSCHSWRRSAAPGRQLLPALDVPSSGSPAWGDSRGGREPTRPDLGGDKALRRLGSVFRVFSLSFEFPY